MGRQRPCSQRARVLLLSLGGVALSLVLSACAAGPMPPEPCGHPGGCGTFRQQWRQRTALQQQRGVGVHGAPRPDWKEAGARRGSREEEERWKRIEKRLDEYYAWGLERWEETARMRLRALDSRHLLTEHPLRTQSLDALTHAVLTCHRPIRGLPPEELAIEVLAGMLPLVGVGCR